MAKGEINIHDVAKKIVCRVIIKGKKKFYLLNWIAIQIIKIAFMIFPFHCEVTIEKDE